MSDAMDIPAVTEFEDEAKTWPDLFYSAVDVKPHVAAMVKSRRERVLANFGKLAYEGRIAKGAPAPVQTDSTHNLTPQLQVNYMNRFGDFAYPFAAPVVETENLAGGYWVWEAVDTVGARARKIQSSGKPIRLTDRRKLESYVLTRHAVARVVSDEEVQNENSAVMSVARATDFTIAACMQFVEDDLANYFGASHGWSYQITGVAGAASPNKSAIAQTATQWSNHGRTAAGAYSSNPISDVRTAATAVLRGCGTEPSVLIAGPSVYNKLLDHPQLLYRVAGGQTNGVANVSMDNIGFMFGNVRVVQMKARKSALANGEFFIDDDALLLVSPMSKGIGDLSGLCTVTFGPQGSFGIRTRVYRDEERASNVIASQITYQLIRQDAQAGCAFIDIVA